MFEPITDKRGKLKPAFKWVKHNPRVFEVPLGIPIRRAPEKVISSVQRLAFLRPQQYKGELPPFWAPATQRPLSDGRWPGWVPMDEFPPQDSDLELSTVQKAVENSIDDVMDYDRAGEIGFAIGPDIAGNPLELEEHRIEFLRDNEHDGEFRDFRTVVEVLESSDFATGLILELDLGRFHVKPMGHIGQIASDWETDYKSTVYESTLEMEWYL